MPNKSNVIRMLATSISMPHASSANIADGVRPWEVSVSLRSWLCVSIKSATEVGFAGGPSQSRRAQGL